MCLLGVCVVAALGLLEVGAHNLHHRSKLSFFYIESAVKDIAMFKMQGMWYLLLITHLGDLH